MKTLISAQRQHELEHHRIAGDPLSVRHRVDESGRSHHLVALIDADKEFRRNDCHLDRPELRAFDLSRDRAELARRVNLALDAAARILFHGGREIPAIGVGYVIDCRGRDLHRDDLVLSLHRTERQR